MIQMCGSDFKGKSKTSYSDKERKKYVLEYNMYFIIKLAFQILPAFL